MSDGIKFPVAVSGAALLGVVFGGGGLWFKVDSQADTIAELRRSQISGERIAKCESRLEALEKEDLDVKESIRALWRARGRSDRDDR